MEQINIIANYYFNMGFNITHITLNRKNYHKNLKTTLYHWDVELKAPSHNWSIYQYKRQELIELNSFNWQEATGLGVVLGFNKLRALDIDDCTDLGLIKQILCKLKLPINYEWLVRSGSKNGFHIIFYANDHNYVTTPEKNKAFLPNEQNKSRFKHIELRWIGHLVLPPSLHPSFYKYEFENRLYPYQKPFFVEIQDLEEAINLFCRKKQNLTIETNSDFTLNSSLGNDNLDYINSHAEEEEAYRLFEGTIDCLDKDEEVEEAPDTSGNYIDKDLQRVHIF